LEYGKACVDNFISGKDQGVWESSKNSLAAFNKLEIPGEATIDAVFQGVGGVHFQTSSALGVQGIQLRLAEGKEAVQARLVENVYSRAAKGLYTQPSGNTHLEGLHFTFSTSNTSTISGRNISKIIVRVFGHELVDKLLFLFEFKQALQAHDLVVTSVQELNCFSSSGFIHWSCFHLKGIEGSQIEWVWAVAVLEGAKFSARGKNHKPQKA